MDEVHIGGERTTIGGASLAVGAASLARAHLRHQPPTALELENAIAAIEDEIMRSAASLRVGDTVQTGDERIRALAHACAASGTWRVEAVEQAFGQLAERGIPADPEAAATLLIVRELMHHLGISTLMLRTA